MPRDSQTVGPETAPYAPSPENDARLGVTPSILVTDYLCQVPQRKPWGSLITSVLVADLVFLRTLWTIISFVASYFAQRHDPLANSCETCSRKSDGDVGLEDEKRTSSSVSARGSIMSNGADRETQYSALLGEQTTGGLNTHLEESTEATRASDRQLQESRIPT
jgi:hypothetical protein